MKFVGGPVHGEDVPDWARTRSEVYLETTSQWSSLEGLWVHPRVHYVRRTWLLDDGREIDFFACLDTGSEEDIEDSARMLLQEDV